ncbi:MAG: hemerythrin family protein [Hahellaceae bacterium]|nr:hemerythrin family protein [Hahellaceae bacterium]
MQKFSYVMSWVCLVLAVVSAVFCYLKGQTLGFNHVIPASAGATAFFFMTAGGVLMTIGTTNLPKLHFDKDEL